MENYLPFLFGGHGGGAVGSSVRLAILELDEKPDQTKRKKYIRGWAIKILQYLWASYKGNKKVGP